MLRVELIGDHSVVFIEGELGIYNAAATRDDLLAYAQTDGELRLDLSGVTEVDSAGVQLLLATLKQAQQDQRGLRLINPSDRLLGALRLLNLSDRFTLEFPTRTEGPA